MCAAIVGGLAPVPGVGGASVQKGPCAGVAFKTIVEGMVGIHDNCLSDDCKRRENGQKQHDE